MKRFYAIALSVVALSLCVSTNANAGSIKYYGSKAGLFRPCRGDLVSVCKEIITDKVVAKDDACVIASLALDQEDETSTVDQTEYAIVKYDGVEYLIPLENINLEDGSIDAENL